MSQGNIEALIRFFEHIKCSSPMFPSKSGGVVSVSRNAKLPEAFEKLIKNRILAIPVVSESGEAVSVFSMLDLVDHLVNTFSEEELKHLNSKKTFDLFFHYTELKEKKVELLSEKVGQILEKELKDIATLDPVFAIEDGKYVIDAIKIMVHSNAHRVVVYNPTDGQLTGIVTQSRVLEFLGTMLECIPDVNTMIKDLNMGTKEVVTIHEDKMAISAFKLMKERRVSGIAVVDSAGVIVGNVSANDLKLVGYDLSYFDYLARSIREYLSWVNGVELAQTPKTSIRSQMLLKHQTEKKNPRDTLVISCTPDNTLGFVIKTLNFYRVHRIYIVDHDNKPTGIISLHDIITFIFKNRL